MQRMTRIGICAIASAVFLIMAVIASEPVQDPANVHPYEYSESRQYAEQAATLEAVTSSIGTVVPAWRRSDIRALDIEGRRYEAPAYLFVEAIAHGPCAVRAQIADFVTDAQEQCFDSVTYGTGRGGVIIPIRTDSERIIQLGRNDRWWRVSQLRTRVAGKRRGARS